MRRVLTEDRPSSGMPDQNQKPVKVGETEEWVQIYDPQLGVVKQVPKAKITESGQGRRLLME